MIHVKSERVTPETTESVINTLTSNEVAAKRLLKKTGVQIVGATVALVAVIHFANKIGNNEILEEV